LGAARESDIKTSSHRVPAITSVEHRRDGAGKPRARQPTATGGTAATAASSARTCVPPSEIEHIALAEALFLRRYGPAVHR
jgi:hypothetical protein